MDNQPEAALAYLACRLTGAIAVPLDTRYKTSGSRAMLPRVRPALYKGQAALYESVSDVAPDVLAPGNRFFAGLERPAGARNWTDLADVAGDEERPAFRLSDIDRNAPAILLAMPGAMGPSKLAV